MRQLINALAIATAMIPTLLPVSDVVAQQAGNVGIDQGRFGDPVVARASSRISLSAGTSQTITLPRDAADVLVASESVAFAEVRTPRKIIVSGLADGVTTLTVNDANGHMIAIYEIRVTPDIALLREALSSAVPGADISIKSLGSGVLLTGQASSPLEAEQAADIARAFLGSEARVVNGISVRVGEQVMLKVTIAEVQRSVLKKLGVSASGTWEVGGAEISGSISELASTGGGGATSFLGANGSINLAALEQAGVSRTLAEPTVVAVSGETSKMLVGGEIPVPTGVSCADNGGTCQPSIEFKNYGVSLSFTPVVLDAGRISLKVATEVSDVDPETSTIAPAGDSSFTIPGFKIRRSESVVELPSGASLVTAGLIQERSRAKLSGVPGAKDVPVIGSLFRSREYQRQETELVISVTPYLAKASQPAAVAKPGAGMVDAVDTRGFFIGEVNRIYGRKASQITNAGHYTGAGFIVD